METVFFQVSAVLAIAVALSVIVRLIRQPMMVAYILTGIVAGPMLLDLFHGESDVFATFSQLGVILLLFVVGLSLNFSYIRKIGRVAVVTGVGQVVFTGSLGILILRLLGFGWQPALYLAVAITFSSTIVITKLLGDKRETDTVYGRHTIGLMLVQDVIAIVLMILLTAGEAVGKGGLAESLLALTVKGAALVGLVLLLSRHILPKLLSRIARSAEFLFLFALGWCFVFTYMVGYLGFSYEIGAIMAGIALGSCAYQLEIGAKMRPLRDFFLIMFFISMGAEMNLLEAGAAVGPGLILSAFVIFGNPLILYLLFRRMGFTRRNSFLSGITAAQVSEFGFVLLFIAREMGAIGQAEITIFTVVALLTIFSSSYLITYGDRVFRVLDPFLALFSKEKAVQPETPKERYDVWVVGYHRIGWKICEALKRRGSSYAVIDFNPDAVAELEEKGMPAFFGDVADSEFLEELPLDSARMVISTIPEAEAQAAMIAYLRRVNPAVTIVANIPEAKYRGLLYDAGADYVMSPHLLGGSWLAQMIRDSRLDQETLAGLRREQEEEVGLGMPITHL